MDVNPRRGLTTVAITGTVKVVLLWLARQVLLRRPGHAAARVLLTIGLLGVAHLVVALAVDLGLVAAGVRDGQISGRGALRSLPRHLLEPMPPIGVVSTKFPAGLAVNVKIYSSGRLWGR